jgi:3-oxoacyl-(acyl-carrier-protein) synthase
MTLNDGIIPPTLNYNEPDLECDLDIVANHPREKNVKTVLCNAFGIGGQNASLVLQQFKG